MYKITIRTKSGDRVTYSASEGVFQSFKGWLIGGEGTAETDPAMFRGSLPGHTIGGYGSRPCGTFLFENGAIIKDNIDSVSWQELVEQVAGHASQRVPVEMLDEYRDAMSS